MNDGSKRIANFAECNLCQLLSVNAGDVSVTDGVFCDEDVKAALCGLSGRGRDADVGLTWLELLSDGLGVNLPCSL